MTREPFDLPPEPWKGETYYGRPQLKAAPFKPGVVGGYIFLAGLSGAAAMIGALASAADARKPTRPRARRASPRHDRLIRRSHYLSLLAPALGSPLLIYDLHTPQRFYNMLRIAKKTSPMSIGTWILMGFSAFAGLGGAAQMIADLKPRWRRPRRIAAGMRAPAAIAGAGLATYTASLLSATSTPLWAATPRGLAVRFASSSIATGAAALAIGEPDARVRRGLHNLLLAALTSEAVASVASDVRYRETGVEAGRSGAWGKVDRYAATGLGIVGPISLLVASRIRRRNGKLADAAALATIAGGLLMRISTLGAGTESALRPDVSMRFAQPRSSNGGPKTSSASPRR